MAKKKKHMVKPTEIEDSLILEELAVEPSAITTSAKKAAASGGKSHYIDNKKMLVVMSEYRQLVEKHKQNLKNGSTDIKPRIPEYIGQCILEIAQRLSSKPNFVNYVHREEMIGDAIECCIRYADNFDPAKSSNPFAYFTQIIFNAFIRRIQREKQQMFVKMKLVEKLDRTGEVRRRVRDQNPLYNLKDNTYAEIFNLSDKDIEHWEEKSKKKSGQKKENKQTKDKQSKKAQTPNSESTNQGLWKFLK